MNFFAELVAPHGHLLLGVATAYVLTALASLFYQRVWLMKLGLLLSATFVGYMTWLFLVTTQYYNRVLTAVFTIMGEFQMMIQMVMQFIVQR